MIMCPMFPEDDLRPAPSMCDTVRYESEALRRHTARLELHRRDPVLSLLYHVEAVAAHRSDNDVSALAKLSHIADLAAEAIERKTGQPFHRNEFWP